MSILVDGKQIAKEIREELKNKLLTENIKPTLAVILVGNHDASKVYVRNKNKACLEIGMDFVECNLPEDISQEQLLNEIDKLNKDTEVDGIMINLPLPPQISATKVLNRIKLIKDVLAQRKRW